MANRYSLAIINNTSGGNTGKSSGTGTSSGTCWFKTIEIPKGKESAIFEQRPTADNESRDRSHLLYSGSRAFPSPPFDPLEKRGDGGVSPLLLDPSQRGLAPPLRGPYKRPSHRPYTSTRTMLLIGPVTVFSFAFFSVAILLHTQVSHLHHYGPQGVQQRLHTRQIRRIVGPPGKHAQRVRLVVRMQARPVDQESNAPVNRPPRAREAAAAVRVRLYHVHTKPGDIPRKPERPAKHRPVLVRTITIRSSQHPRSFPGCGGQPAVARRRAPPGTETYPRRHLTPAPSTTTTSSGRRSRLYRHLRIRVN